MKHSSVSSSRASGFTLVEALLVLAVAAVVLAIASPNFSSLSATMRVRSTTADLLADLNFARSEAVKRNSVVAVSPLGGQWTQGWSITRIDPADASRNEMLRTRNAVGNMVGFSGAPTSLSFDAAGRVVIADISSFKVCPPDSTGMPGRLVRIDPSGQSRSTSVSCT
ncbi:MAG TPA: GspH/FimT family protein [Burkholderiaceae bacterium]|nr:GspH/FimT family protein [Burkholderiaceae bacterium]